MGGRFTLIKNVARYGSRRGERDVPRARSIPTCTSRSPNPTRRSLYTRWVYSMDVSPDGWQPGDHRQLHEGQRTAPRPQAALLPLAHLSTTPASLANWETDRYIPLCFSTAFDTYMRDVDFSPDGSYFVIATTGGPNVGTFCDTAAPRWETRRAGTALEPTWVDVTGGDTLSAVGVTGSVVYVGGHQRWMNNWYGIDAPGPGAIDRPGIAALDPSNGLPFSWNPTRDRGAGEFALFSTNTGLWMGSDTDRVAGELRRKIAFFPLAGGKTPPPTDPYTLPGDLYNVPASSCQAVDASILYRVNTGGPGADSLDCGPDWLADDSDGAPGASFRNSGSNAVPPWGQPFTVDATVPATTPSTIFDSERWDPGDGDPMQWTFPVTAGKNIAVRLFFANQYGGTAPPGQRVFDVAIDGVTRLDDYDIAADVGHQVGTMKSLNIVSDGTVNIDFSHVDENPLINGIEIIDTDVAPPPSDDIDFLARRTFDGSALGSTSNLNTPTTDWSTTRGIFALQGTLYSGSTDGKFYARTFDGSGVGPAQQIDLHGLTDFPVQSLTGMFYSKAEIYYTVKGDPNMYHRYFTTESQIVGSFRFTVASPVDWSSVRGMTLANGKLYFARTDVIFHPSWTSPTARLFRARSRSSARPPTDMHPGRRTVCSCSPTSPPTTTHRRPPASRRDRAPARGRSRSTGQRRPMPHPRSPIGSTGTGT